MSDPSKLPPGPFCLSDLVSYQDGSVVSRTLIKKPAGTITVFAFAAGQALSEHTVPHDALVQVIEGEAEITVSGVMAKVAAGETILMPGGEPHAVNAAQSFKMTLTMLKN